MAATDTWDSSSGIERRAPEDFRMPRQGYVREAPERMAPKNRADQAAQPPAGDDLPERLAKHFSAVVSVQTPAVRRRINAKLALVVTGYQSGAWSVDFISVGPEYVREGLATDWTYKIETEDKLLYPFLTGERQFFEHLLLSLRVRLAGRPDEYNEPLYHFLYDLEQHRILEITPGLASWSRLVYPNEVELLGRCPDPEEFYVTAVIPRKIAVDLEL
jgi:hypothetical protein